MSYIFLDALRTEKFYKNSGRYIQNELNKIKDLNLIYNDIHKVYDISTSEKILKHYLDKLENRSVWLRSISVIVLLISFIQFLVVIYIAFELSNLNVDQTNLLLVSFSLVAINSVYLSWEYKKFQNNKHEALKLFLMVKSHNYQLIINEREAKLNPRIKYKEGSPMDLLFGEDN